MDGPRRHPVRWVAAIVAFALTLVLVGGLAAGLTPECRAFKRGIESEARERMKTLYMGDGDPDAVDRAYIPQGSSYEEILDQLESQVEFERREGRPSGCF